MINHEKCLPADNSHEKSYLIFFRKLGKTLENLSSAAVVIGALRDNSLDKQHCYRIEKEMYLILLIFINEIFF